MHKLSLIAILLVAVLAVEGAPKRRGFYTRRISRPQSRPFTQYDARASASFGFPLNNYISMQAPMPLNFPMQFGPSPRLGHRLPDGDYRTAYGIASVDGSDISMDSY